VTVQGNGSAWNSGSALYVGRYGQGTLNVTEGGTVSSYFGYIGRRTGSIGSVIVDGDGSIWTNDSNLSVGLGGTATLALTDGGAVTVGGSLSVHNLSTIAFTFSSPTDPLLDVTNNASLDGALTVELAQELVLQENDTFTLIDIGGERSGEFANMAEGDLAASDGVFDLWLTYNGGNGNDVEVYALPTVPGDMNADGQFDLADAEPFVLALTDRATYGALYPTVDVDLRGDLDGSGSLNLADIGPFKNLLAQNGLSASALRIPEPSSGLLCAMALAMLLGGPPWATPHRRKKHK